MDKLPDEILHKIFTQTTMMQKQECMLVCGRWASLIRTRCLFRTVQIRNSPLYERFIDLIERIPSYGRQVEYLVLFKCLKDTFDRRKLLRLFPNLKEIKMRGEKRTRTIHDAPRSKKRFELIAFKSQMECIVDYDECELTRYLASSGLCTRMMTLTLNLNLSNACRTDIFSVLKDMPLLKKLTIENTSLTFSNCETLHENLPSVEQLTFIKVGCISGNLPEKIKPATSVTSLYVKMRDVKLHRHVDWPSYIHRKYTRLIQFRYTIPNYGFHSRHLKNFSEVGYLPLVKDLGPQLRTISFMGVDTDISVLSQLDSFKCRIREFIFTAKELCKGLDTLSKTKQAGYIQQLTVMRMFPAGFDWLKKMRRLKSLELYYLDPQNFVDNVNAEYVDFIKQVTVNLKELFECCPKTVESMFIQKAYLGFDPLQEGMATYNVKKLSLDQVKLVSGIDMYISLHFPYLHSLTLSDCLDRNAILSFPKHSFSYFEISILSGNINISLSTSDTSKPHFYSTSSKRSRLGYSELATYLAPITFKDIEEPEYITLSCESVKVMTLNGLRPYFPENDLEYKSFEE